MNHRLRFIPVLASLLLALCCGAAKAELVGTEEAAASLEPAKPNAEREKLRALLERPEVVEKLKAVGVSADDAKARVGAMSDAEIHMIAGKLDMLPAGGKLSNNDLLLVVVIILAVVLLVIVI
ncbi:MAG TPA: PA2779 family protein [Burkholderiales bacterium]|nr:PA2779 family protein [Burkholderiales bacterium]